MTFAAFLRNYRRILALVLASALLHALALLLLAYVPAESTVGGTPARLVIAARLTPLAPEPSTPLAASAETPAEAPPVAAPTGMPGARTAEPAGPSSVRDVEATDAFAVQVDAASMIAQAAELPGTQNTRLPATAAIRYDVQHRAARADSWSPAGSAALTWQRGPDSYRLEAASTPAGATAPSHTMSSEGIIGDAGILPVRARNTGIDGTRETLFDRESGRIIFSGADRSAPVGPASQDQVSMLMQLAALANADPAQMEGAVDIHVSGAGIAGVVRFEVLGLESIDTPMGAMQALHLAQKADAGRARVDIWLAPAHDYLPVQMVSRLEDGREVRQAAASITR